MWDLFVGALALILLPLVIFRTNKNGILLCKISFVIVFLIIACEVIAIITKDYNGENMIFNIITIPVQAINLISLSMSFYAYKEMEKKENRKNVNAKDVVV